jgi:uncharacterized membrane protein
MNIEQIKSEWKQFSQQLESSQRLNEHLLMSMLKERSRSRVSKIRRDNMIYLLLMFANLAFLAAIFLGNPFDFKYRLQFAPYALLAAGVIMAVVSLIRSLKRFNADLNQVNLDSFLTTTIAGYEKNKQMERWFGLIIFSAGTLTVLSFLPKKLAHKPLGEALVETALSILITLGIYFTAYKLGAFKNRNREGFENDLKELNELRAIASDLKN